MNAPSISFSFSFLNQITEGFRIFVLASIIGTYLLVLYELFPEFLFNPNFAMFYFVFPVAILGGVLLGIPRFVFKKAPKPKATMSQNKSGDELLNEIIAGNEGELIQSSETAQQGTEGAMAENSQGVTLDPMSVGGPNPELEALLAGGSGDSSNTISPDASLGGSVSGLNEGMIRDMIDQKFEPVEKDLSSFKKDLNKIKEDMKITKENVDSLTESFEGTLTDMKAFQAEIANPLNFMRKYFESIDLKSLSDPSLPLRQMTGDVSDKSAALPQQSIVTTPLPQQSLPPAQNYTISPTSPSPSKETLQKQTEMERIEAGIDLDNPMDSVMKPLFSGNLSVSNLMAIVELAGEMLKENGDDCIDLLIEQCKLMGLKDEDESTIYNIIDMLKKSGMNVEDTLIQLYKFAKIVGINDKEADSHYTKLVTNQRKNKDKKKSEDEE